MSLLDVSGDSLTRLWQTTHTHLYTQSLDPWPDLTLWFCGVCSMFEERMDIFEARKMIKAMRREKTALEARHRQEVGGRDLVPHDGKALTPPPSLRHHVLSCRP
jgi:hypothetical protein